uniref:Uncharacterized protein n=1 Tax=Moniliophthora roreri TaxID=221103 RepID=A0A0W0FFH8_MONRR
MVAKPPGSMPKGGPSVLFMLLIQRKYPQNTAIYSLPDNI